MGCFMNVLWLVLGGIFTALEYVVSSVLLMVTIVGIPFGMQTLKLAGLALWPFGKTVRTGERAGGCLYILMNVLWILVGGIWIAVSHLVFGCGERLNPTLSMLPGERKRGVEFIGFHASFL